jgi:hypothetical protein
MADATPVHAAPKADPKAQKSSPAPEKGADLKELHEVAMKEGKSAFMVHGDPKAQPALRVDH